VGLTIFIFFVSFYSPMLRWRSSIGGLNREEELLVKVAAAVGAEALGARTTTRSIP
jgi:hypothetical protein